MYIYNHIYIYMILRSYYYQQPWCTCTYGIATELANTHASFPGAKQSDRPGDPVRNVAASRGCATTFLGRLLTQQTSTLMWKPWHMYGWIIYEHVHHVVIFQIYGRFPPGYLLDLAMFSLMMIIIIIYRCEKWCSSSLREKLPDGCPPWIAGSQKFRRRWFWFP